MLKCTTYLPAFRARCSRSLPFRRGARTLPEPVFPPHPRLPDSDDNYEEMLDRAKRGKRPWSTALVLRAIGDGFSLILNRQGYKMVNSIKRLQDMKDFQGGKVEPGNCRAGQNSIIIRTDGRLAPCFPMYSATEDWGAIEEHKFEVRRLNDMKKTCQTHCFSTLNHNLHFCYNDARVIRWVLEQAKPGFQGVTGSFA
jgi:hypothetical protein